MQLPDKLKAALVAIILALLFAGSARAQATGQGYQGPVQFSPGCAGALRYGNMYACFDTVNNGWFYWSYTANAGKGAFVPIPVNAGNLPIANVACPIATHNAESEGCAIGATTPAAATFTGLTAGLSSGNINITGGSASTANTISKVDVNGVVNVTDPKYGADSTGATDASAAINAAVSAAGVQGQVVIPSGKYLITAGLNLTALNGLTLKGPVGTVHSSSVELVCNTGSSAPCIDETGSQGVTLSDITLDTLDNSPSTPSTIGILQARAPAVNSNLAQQNKMVRVFINFKTLGAGVNSGHGSIAVYNYGAELTNYDNVTFQADTAVILSNSNTLGVTSPYQTIATSTQSMSQVKFTGASILTSDVGIGARLVCDGLCSDIDLNSTYMNTAGTTGTLVAAIQGGVWQRLRWTGARQEYITVGATPPPLIELKSSGALQDSVIWDILDNVGTTPSAIKLDTGAGTCPLINNTRLAIRNDLATNPTSLISESGSGCTGLELSNVEIYFEGGFNALNLAQGSAEKQLMLSGGVSLGGVTLPTGSLFLLNNYMSAAGLVSAGYGNDVNALFATNLSSGGHSWAIQANATGTSAICGAGGLCFNDTTHAGVVGGFDQNGDFTLLNPYMATVWSGITANVGATSTDYLAFGQNAGQAVISSEANAKSVWPYPGTASKLQCYVTTAAGAAGDVMTVRLTHSGSTANTALTCTVPNTGTTCFETSATFAVAAGDSLDMSIGGGSNTNATGVASCSFLVTH